MKVIYSPGTLGPVWAGWDSLFILFGRGVWGAVKVAVRRKERNTTRLCLDYNGSWVATGCGSKECGTALGHLTLNAIYCSGENNVREQHVNLAYLINITLLSLLTWIIIDNTLILSVVLSITLSLSIIYRSVTLYLSFYLSFEQSFFLSYFLSFCYSIFCSVVLSVLAIVTYINVFLENVLKRLRWCLKLCIELKCQTEISVWTQLFLIRFFSQKDLGCSVHYNFIDLYSHQMPTVLLFVSIVFILRNFRRIIRDKVDTKMKQLKIPLSPSSNIFLCERVAVIQCFYAERSLVWLWKLWEIRRHRSEINAGSSSWLFLALYIKRKQTLDWTAESNVMSLSNQFYPQCLFVCDAVCLFCLHAGVSSGPVSLVWVHDPANEKIRSAQSGHRGSSQRRLFPLRHTQHRPETHH